MDAYDLYSLEQREREADEALYRVDPDFARELGYVPPPPPDPAFHDRMQRMLSQAAMTQQHQMGAFQQQLLHNQMRAHRYPFGSMLGAVGTPFAAFGPLAGFTGLGQLRKK